MSGAGVSPSRDDLGRRELAVFISIQTILLVGVAVALAWALASIGHVLPIILAAVVLDEATARRRARIAADDVASHQPA
jgi:ABC-type cobalamin transport system permease subunit